MPKALASPLPEALRLSQTQTAMPFWARNWNQGMLRLQLSRTSGVPGPP